MSDDEQKVYTLLDSLGIRYERREHPPVYTCEQADAYDFPGAARAKNLLLANADRSKFYLLILDAAKKLKAKALARAIGEKSLSFATPEELQGLFGVSPGAVSPFGLMHSGAGNVAVIIDHEIAACAIISCHPNVNTATVCLSMDDLFKVFAHLKNNVIPLDFTAE